MSVYIPAHQGGTSQCGAYEQVQPHGAKEWGSVGGAAWRRRRERRRRERTGAEAGRMLRCERVRLYPRRRCGAGGTWRRGADTGVVQAAWCSSRWLRVRVRVRVSRKRTGAEAGRMLRCACLRLSTTQVRRRRHLKRRGSETGVVQAAWCRGRGAGVLTRTTTERRSTG